MKRILIFTTCLLLWVPYIRGQLPVMTITENFDGNTVSFTSTPVNAWRTHTNYALSSPNSYRTRVPNHTGDIVILESPPYDFSSYSSNDASVQLRFSHICKISPNDITRIEYKIPGSTWQPLDKDSYLGNASNYDSNKAFNAASYPQWQAGDSLAMPSNTTWWKEEVFDVSYEVKGEAQVQFRFVLERGSTPGTQISYGWLIDDFIITATNYKISLPVVEFMDSSPQDTVYSVGPHAIEAKVKTTTNARIKNPWLKYTATYNNNVVETDSLLMENISGDSLWSATIKQFRVGTEVSYFIRGEDTTGNYATRMSQYVICMPPAGILTTDYIYFGAYDSLGGAGNRGIVFWENNLNTWSRHLYLNSELEGLNTSASTFIKSIAYRTTTASSSHRASIRIYMKATTQATQPQRYINPVSDGATLVYQGPMNMVNPDWINLQFTELPFFLPAGNNLMVYLEDDSPSAGSYTWRAENSRIGSVGMTVYGSSIGTYSNNAYKPVTRFAAGTVSTQSNLVTLDAIDNPAKLSVTGGVENPIIVTIHNKGFAALDSVTVYWRVNGGNTNEYAWKGDLPWDYKSRDTIGEFIPRTAMADTLVVWIAMPNGQVDPITSDDKISVILFGCTGQLEGDYTIGEEGYFPSFEDAVTAIANCGVKGNVRLLLTGGVYSENWEFSDLGDHMGPYMLTLTRAPGDSVIVKPASGVAITMANVKNFAIDNITIDISPGTIHGIQFLDRCTNIVINNCLVLGSKISAESYNLIAKPTSGHRVDGIRITNNRLDGGRIGIYLYGSATNLLDNVIIENNIIQNQYFYGIHSYYANCLSVSYNTISTRGASSQQGWSGIYMYRSFGPVIGNRIKQNYAQIINLSGIKLDFYHSGSSPMGLVANNEIMLSTSSSSNIYYGINSTGSNVRILHNSFLSRSSGSARGIYIADTDNSLEIKNNVLIIAHPTTVTAYPIYLEGNNYSQWDINSNCYYAFKFVGFAGGGIGDLGTWASVVTTDVASVKILPAFINYTVDLQLPDTTTTLFCPALPLVPKDKGLFFRIGKTTTMGCYEAIPPIPNGMLEEIIGLHDGSPAGQTDSLKVVLVNAGTDTIREVNIGWSLNGQVSSNTVTKQMLLPLGAKDTITLAEITYPAQDLVTKVWINSIGTPEDMYRDDDTISTTTFVCASLLEGPYVIGTTGAYSSIEAIFSAMATCGVSNDIQLQLKDGTYDDNLMFSDIGTIMGPYTLTITTVPGDSVSIKPASGTGITLRNASNLVFDHLTIDVRTGAHGIQLFDGCSNIVINNCRILSSTTSKITNYPICKGTATDKVDNLRITHNFLDGGYYGIYLLGNNANRVGNVVIENNLLQNQYHSGIYAQLADCLSISYNTVLSREAGELYASWCGIYMNASYGPITGNRIVQRTPTTITTPAGIYLNNYHRTGNAGLVANNEIMLNATDTCSGIYSDYSNSRIFHNSIYNSSPSGDGRGIYITNSSTGAEIKNNNIVCLSSQAYPLYLNGLLSRYNINWNNYYAPSFIGYVSSTNITSLPAWKQLVAMDVSSVNIRPSYINGTASLKLFDYTFLKCPSLADVGTDIEGSTRYIYTFMGAYTREVSNTVKVEIESCGWEEKTVFNMSQPMAVLLTNVCSIPIESVVFEWELNGIPQSPYHWTASSPVGTYDTLSIPTGSFAVPRDSSKVKIWVSAVNDLPFTSNEVIDSCYYVPLAEFVAPFVSDTIGTLFFDVALEVFTRSGAPATNPRIELTTKVNQTVLLYDTITMTYSNGEWIAHIPEQYYNSTVVYAVTIEDTVGNAYTIADLTFMKFLPPDTSEIDVGVFTTARSMLPPVDIYTGQSGSKSLYLRSEMSLLPNHTYYIRELSWDLYNILDGINNSNLNIYPLYDQSLYLKAVSDEDLTDPNYLNWVNPIQDGATLVWSGDPRVRGVSRNTFQLTTPFELPPNMNLLVYWVNEDYRVNTRTGLYWGHSDVPNMTVFNSGDNFPSGSGYLLSIRPNITFKIERLAELYTQHDLSMASLLEPVNKEDTLCSSDYASIKVALSNWGSSTHNFYTDNVTLHVKVTGPVAFKASKVINTGSLDPGKTRVVDIANTLPVLNSGEYDIKVWLNSPLDKIAYDDTLRSTYISERVYLPVDEDFSNGVSPLVFTSKGNTTYRWKPIGQGTGADTAVKPVFGSKVLSFSGSRGAIASLSTRELQLANTLQPVLEFWYFHDTVELEDYMEVNITVDGRGYIPLLSLVKTDIAYGWKRYEVDLSPYTNNSCVGVFFESMIVTENVVQYIDRIRITSQPDVSVAGIITSELSACDLHNKAWKVILANETAQEIDFTTEPTAIQLDIIDNVSNLSFTYSLDSGKLKSNSSDTFELATNFNFTKGTYIATAYLTIPIDDNPGNDTRKDTVIIDPSLSVKINQISGENTNCLNAGSEMNQTVVITNTGNMELANMNVILSIDASDAVPPYTNSIKESISGTVLPGDTIEYTFKNSYTIPWSPTYQLQSVVYLVCDSAMVNNSSAIAECVNVNNLALVSIDKPSGQVDTVGRKINIEITLENKSDVTPFSNVVIHARIEDSQGNTISQIPETISRTIDPLHLESHVFSSPYTVPNDSIYYITVFIEKQDKDIYQQDDTLQMKRITDYNVGIESRYPSKFSMEQNIPNPANTATIIRYSILESDEIIFRIHSMNGKLLYNKTIQSVSGINAIEIKTSGLPAGIYTYSMEYKGQRIVKRMSVER